MRFPALPRALFLLGAAPWRLAPLLLRRHPAVAAGVAVATGILCAAAATLPLFLGSVESAALHRQLDERCAPTLGWTYGISTSFAGGGPSRATGGELLDARRNAIAAAAADVPHVAPLEQTLHTSVLRLSTEGGGTIEPVRFMHRTSFDTRVEIIEGGGDDGLWITDTTARRIGLSVGEHARIEAGPGSTSLPVVAIYRDLATGGEPPAEWCFQRSVIVPPGAFSDLIPPPVVFVDEDRLITLAEELGAQVTTSWELPLVRGDLTLDEATAAARAFASLPERALHHEAFRPAPGDSFLRRPASELPFIVERARAVAAAVRGAVGPVSIAGTIVALAMVASAGSYWADRRRTEITLLSARGVGRGAIAFKGLIEMLLPAMAGGLAGWAAAAALVGVLGPHPLLPQGVAMDGLGRAGASLAIALAVLAVVVFVRAGIDSRPPRRSLRLARRLPWEAILLVAAGWALLRLRTNGAPIAEGARVPPVDVLLLAFPLLFLAGGTALGLRLAARALPWLRRRSRSWSPAVFLGAQRVTAGRQAAGLLAAATALSAGVLVYAATLTGSTAASFEAKAGVYVGSDVGVSLVDDIPLPERLAGRATTLFRTEAKTETGRPVSVLAVDPATFADAAFWDDSFAEQPLPRILSQLDVARSTTRDGRAVPVLVAGPWPATLDMLVFEGRAAPNLEVRVVARARTFPGLRGRDPMIVLDKATIADAVQHREHLLWADATPDEVADVLRHTDARARFARDTSEILDAPLFYTVIWTFGLLQALGVLTALIMVGGLMLHLESRQRARVASYGLARQMGMSRGAHAASVTVELAISLGPGWLVGTTLAVGAAMAVHPYLDPAAAVPPAALFRVPALVIAGVALAGAGITAVGALVAQRAADRSPLSEVMRLGR